MADITVFPIPTKVLTPADYPEFVGATGATGAAGADGTDGTDGTDGRTVLSGAVDPTTEGEDGDFYINTETSTIFGPKATTWPAGVSLVGPQGIQGIQGTQGPAGSVENGMTVINHAADETVARTVGAAAVYWIGSVEPLNAADGDLWIEVSA